MPVRKVSPGEVIRSADWNDMVDMIEAAYKGIWQPCIFVCGIPDSRDVPGAFTQNFWRGMARHDYTNIADTKLMLRIYHRCKVKTAGQTAYIKIYYDETLIKTIEITNTDFEMKVDEVEIADRTGVHFYIIEFQSPSGGAVFDVIQLRLEAVRASS